MELTADQKDHHLLMMKIATSLKDTPLVLIGGTALYLCYGLDRFSVDIDLDTNKKISLESKIKNNIPYPMRLTDDGVKHPRDSAKNSKYDVTYVNSLGNENILTIDMKIKENTDIPFTIINDIKVATINYLIKAKIECIEDRTKSRDLYDLSFLTEQYPQDFDSDDIKRLTNFIKENDLLTKYLEDWINNIVFSAVDITDKIIQLTQNIEKIKAYHSDN